MRKLIILRGLPGSGKSTFISKMGLKDYTLSLDEFRMRCMSPMRNFEGDRVNPMNTKSGVPYDLFYKILENRLECGAFTIIDATNLRRSNINYYKALAEKYRYTISVVDFTDIPVEQAKKQNLERLTKNIVPDEVFDRFVSYLNDEKNKLPNTIKKIDRDMFFDEIKYKPIDLSEYEKVYIIGDIHACYTCLSEFFEKYPFSKKNYYIFLGDYLERGIENTKTLQFMIDLSKRKNVTCLFGNHERYLWGWANDIEVSHNNKFKEKIVPELEENFQKKEVRRFCRRLVDAAYFCYGNKKYICTHAGVNYIPDVFDVSEQFYCNVGSYDDIYEYDGMFNKRYEKNNLVSIHGHANPKGLSAHEFENVFNLEGGIEQGGCLRAVELCRKGDEITENTIEIPNHVYFRTEINPDNVGDSVEALRNNAMIKEKDFGNISSFNFTREAFASRNWDRTTVRARGLFINTDLNEVAARSYNKFFDLGEMPESELSYIKDNFAFPLTAYIKENGYLGMLSYDKDKDKLLFATKSSLNGDHVKYFRNIVEHMFHVKQSLKADLEGYLKNSGSTLLFEVIDPKNDPHIISYPKKNAVLLDEVKNSLNYENTPYDELLKLGNKFGFDVKKKAKVFNTFEEFEEFTKHLTPVEYKDDILNDYVEGYVVEDSKGAQVKIKTGYYLFWKKVRAINDSITTYGDYKGADKLTPELHKIYMILKNNRGKFKNKNIIEVRNLL